MQLLIMVFAVSLAFFSSGNTFEDFQENAKVRAKRNLYQFGLMVSCETNRWPSDYVGYGCWCGLGGKGAPVDDTDQCCKAHDLCYKKAHRNGECYMGAAYITVYTKDGCSGCDKSKNDECEQAVCECDSIAARCFKNSTFNDKYKRYSQSNC